MENSRVHLAGPHPSTGRPHRAASVAALRGAPGPRARRLAHARPRRAFRAPILALHPDSMTTETTTTTRLLAIAPDLDFHGALQDGLHPLGMEVESATNGGASLRRLLPRAFDLVLLDVDLPDVAGWDLLAMLRRAGVDTPVILLASREDVDSRLDGLLSEGDDYVVKPFGFGELRARIQAVLKRRAPSLEWRVGDLVMDHRSGKVHRGDVKLELTRLEYGLLRRLMERRGEPVDRADLLRTVWGIDFNPGTNMVEVHIRRLRQKVDRPFDRPLIHTIRGQGYVVEDRGPV